VRSDQRVEVTTEEWKSLQKRIEGVLGARGELRAFTASHPGTEYGFLKARFIAAAWRRREEEDDFSWSIPDIGAGGEW